MKARNLDSKWLITGIMVFLVLSVSFFKGKVQANGPGTPITPYEKGEQVTEEDIQSVKSICSKNRFISGLQVKGSQTPRYGEQIGFAYVAKNGKIGEPSFNLQGKAESEEEISVDLSGVHSLTLLKVKDRWFTTDTALLEFTIFPDLSPSELLRLNPTYSQLEASYTKRIRMWVDLQDKNKGKLSIVGKTWSEGEGYEVLSKIRDLEPNSRVVLSYPMQSDSPIWWALESVIKDERYPHRIRMLK